MPTFGNTTVKANSSTWSGRKLAVKHVLTERGVVKKLTAYTGANTGTIKVQMGIYSDLDGKPDTLLAKTGVHNFSSTDSPQFAWREFDLLTPVTLEPGTYWLCVWCGYVLDRFKDAGLFRWQLGAKNQCARGSTEDYSGITDSFGTVSDYQDWDISIYATYELPLPPPPIPSWVYWLIGLPIIGALIYWIWKRR